MDIRVGDRVTYKFGTKEHTAIITNEDELQLIQSCEIIKIETAKYEVVEEQFKNIEYKVEE